MALTSRMNTVTGVRYRDDPTIMGWGEDVVIDDCQGM